MRSNIIDLQDLLIVADLSLFFLEFKKEFFYRGIIFFGLPVAQMGTKNAYMCVCGIGRVDFKVMINFTKMMS